MCDTFCKKKKKKEDFLLPLKWSSSPLKLKNQDLHDLFLETLCWINLCLAKNELKLQVFGSLALNVSFCRTALVDKLEH